MPLAIGRAIGVGIFPYYHTIIVVLLTVFCLAITNCCPSTDRGTTIWNSLPTSITEMDSLNSFKLAYLVMFS